MIAKRNAFTFALVLAVEVAVLFWTNGSPWRGEWNWTLDYTVGTTVLTGPLIGGFAAWVCADDRRRGLLVDSTTRGWLAPVRTAAVAVALGTLAFVVALVAALVATYTVPHGGPVTWWLPLVVLPVLALNALLGAAVGHLYPQRVLVVLVPPALFVLGALGDFDLGPRILRQGPTTGTLAGQDFNGDQIGRHVVIMAGLLVLLVAAQAVRRRVRTTAAVVVAVLGATAVVVVGSQTSGQSADRLVATRERPTACAGEAPRVCLLPSNRRSLEPVRRQLHRAIRPLLEIGADVPELFVDAGPLHPGPMDAGVVQLFEANVDHFPLEFAARSVAMPAPCPAWYADTPPAEAAFEAQSLVSSWLLVRMGRPLIAWSPEAEDWLRHTEVEAQGPVIAEIFEQLRTCRLDAITVPWER